MSHYECAIEDMNNHHHHHHHADCSTINHRRCHNDDLNMDESHRLFVGTRREKGRGGGDGWVGA